MASLLTRELEVRMQVVGIHSPTELSSVPGTVGADSKPLLKVQVGERTTAVESLTVCSQMKGASGMSMTTEDSEGVEEVSLSSSGLSRSSRPPVATWDLYRWGLRASAPLSVFLAMEEMLSLFSSPSSIPAKKLLLGWVTANLMGFNKVDEMAEMLVSSELHSESSPGIGFLEWEGRQMSQMKEPTPARAAWKLPEAMPWA